MIEIDCEIDCEIECECEYECDDGVRTVRTRGILRGGREGNCLLLLRRQNKFMILVFMMVWTTYVSYH
jgi:hypothetical protein